MRVVKDFSEKQLVVYKDIISYLDDHNSGLSGYSEDVEYSLSFASEKLNLDIRILESMVKDICECYFETSMNTEQRVSKEEYKPLFISGRFKAISLSGVNYFIVDGEEEPSEIVYYLKILNHGKILADMI